MFEEQDSGANEQALVDWDAFQRIADESRARPQDKGRKLVERFGGLLQEVVTRSKHRAEAKLLKPGRVSGGGGATDYIALELGSRRDGPRLVWAASAVLALRDYNGGEWTAGLTLRLWGERDSKNKLARHDALRNSLKDASARERLMDVISGHPASLHLKRGSFGSASTKIHTEDRETLTRALDAYSSADRQSPMFELVVSFGRESVNEQDFDDRLTRGLAYVDRVAELLEELTVAGLERQTTDTLKDRFAQFREDPTSALQVRIRRERARQLRELLSQPEAMTLDQFNRDVWAIETETRLHGERITGRLLAHETLSDDFRAKVAKALGTDDFEMHGNYTWGSGSKVYGAMLKIDDLQKVDNVRRALGYLVRDDTAPIAKVRAMLEVPGFGANIATGLAMVMSPEGFAIYNKPAIQALTSLGYDASSLEAFQSSARTLRERVGAEDFIELDWFLYKTKLGTAVDPKAGVGHHDLQAKSSEPAGVPAVPADLNVPEGWIEPSLEEIAHGVRTAGLRLDDRTLRRYHLALKTRGFVILSGWSGTGKTWLATAYARAVGARHLIAPVAPNWTSNEDLLGYFNPLAPDGGRYVPTEVSEFFVQAAAEQASAAASGRDPRPYHLVLDEMNLARVEHYFAKFLSAMETRGQGGGAIALDPREQPLLLPANLRVVGTVNVDETTHGFADKVYDRAQLIELGIDRDDLEGHLGGAAYGELLLMVWDAVSPVAPFAYRVLDEIGAYIEEAAELDVAWADALDEAVLQKVLPKFRGSDERVGSALRRLVGLCDGQLPETLAKARAMLDGYDRHGFASFH